MLSSQHPRPPRNCETLERIVLCALSQHFHEEEFRDRTIAALTPYRFVLLDHQLIFAALRQVRDCHPDLFRQTLNSRLAKMGFPELETIFLFENPPCSHAEAHEIIQGLLSFRD